MLSLCSGVGMIDYAAEQAGHTIIGQVEIDPFCQAVLKKHWPHILKISDINKVKGTDFGAIIDIVAGGIPCQPFSVSGKMAGKTDDRWLWPQTFAIVQAYRPTWVLIENVAHAARMVLDDICTDLERESYTTRAFILPACALQAPHVRERIFIVAHSDRIRDTRENRDVASRQRSQVESTSSNTWKNTQENMEYSDSTRCTTPESSTRSNKERRYSGTITAFTRKERLPQSRLGRGIDGYADWLDGYQWPVGPGEAQAAHEAPRTVQDNAPYARHRLKAIGNAVVWQQVYPFFAAMSEVK